MGGIDESSGRSLVLDEGSEDEQGKSLLLHIESRAQDGCNTLPHGKYSFMSWLGTETRDEEDNTEEIRTGSRM